MSQQVLHVARRRDGRLFPHKNTCLVSGRYWVTGLRREIREEAGLECQELELRGTISWPGFGRNGEDWFGFIFRILSWTGQPFSENPEGDLEWVEVAGLLRLPLWEGDRYFLPLVFGDSDRQFHGIMPYENGRPLSWAYSLV